MIIFRQIVPACPTAMAVLRTGRQAEIALVEIIRNVIQVAIGSRPLDWLGQDRLVADQVPVG